MTGDESRRPQSVTDFAEESSQWTLVPSSGRSGVTIDWDDGLATSIQHNDMARVPTN
jgi:hypothetical protein